MIFAHAILVKHQKAENRLPSFKGNEVFKEATCSLVHKNAVRSDRQTGADHQEPARAGCPTGRSQGWPWGLQAHALLQQGPIPQHPVRGHGQTGGSDWDQSPQLPSKTTVMGRTEVLPGASLKVSSRALAAKCGSLGSREGCTQTPGTRATKFSLV